MSKLLYPFVTGWRGWLADKLICASFRLIWPDKREIFVKAESAVGYDGLSSITMRPLNENETEKHSIARLQWVKCHPAS